QNARLTFGGTAGQRVSALTRGSTFGGGCCPAALRLLAPSGAEVSTGAWISPEGFLDARTLPLTGTYTVLVDPSGTVTGGTTVSLTGDVTGAIAINGASVPLSLTFAGQHARLTFSGSQGQQISLGTSAGTIAGGTLSILK